MPLERDEGSVVRSWVFVIMCSFVPLIPPFAADAEKGHEVLTLTGWVALVGLFALVRGLQAGQSGGEGAALAAALRRRARAELVARDGISKSSQHALHQPAHPPPSPLPR